MRPELHVSPAHYTQSCYITADLRLSHRLFDFRKGVGAKLNTCHDVLHLKKKPQLLQATAKVSTGGRPYAQLTRYFGC